MTDEPHIALFCTSRNASHKIVNEVLHAAAEEEQNDERLRNAWVFISSRDQVIFPMPPPALRRLKSDFIDADVGQLGSWCKTRFENTDAIRNEDFAVVDERSLEDGTILFVRWEQYTAEDDSILRILWGQASPSDEKWLKSFVRSDEDVALLRKLQGKATAEDEALLKKAKENALRENESFLHNKPDPVQQSLDDVQQKLKEEQHVRNSSNGMLGVDLKSPGATDIMATQSPLSPHPKSGSRAFDWASQSKSLDAIATEDDEFPNRTETMEGWRTIRIPIETAMRDMNVVMRRSVTDTLKIRPLFDKFGVLRY